MAADPSVSCPNCQKPFHRVDGEGANSYRYWSCDFCRKAISQTSKSVQHCFSCGTDRCPSCEYVLKPVKAPSNLHTLPLLQQIPFVTSMSSLAAKIQALTDSITATPTATTANDDVLKRSVGDDVLKRSVDGVVVEGSSSSTASDALHALFGCSSVGYLIQFQEDTVSGYDPSGNYRKMNWLTSTASNPAEAAAINKREEVAPVFVAILELLRVATVQFAKEGEEAPDEGKKQKKPTRKSILQYFPKGCPGCFLLGIAVTVDLCPSTAQAAEALLHQLFVVCCHEQHDKQKQKQPPPPPKGDDDDDGGMMKPGELSQIGRAARRSYKRQSDPYPYMGNCLDFQPEFSEKVTRIGKRYFSCCSSRAQDEEGGS